MVEDEDEDVLKAVGDIENEKKKNEERGDLVIEIQLVQGKHPKR